MMIDNEKSNIIISNLCKIYVGSKGQETHVFNDLNLVIKEGKITCVMGVSGSGKSTLINIIAGFERATSGEVRMGNIIIDQPNPEIGILFQEHSLFPWKTARKNIEFALKMKGYGKKERRELVTEYLEKINLTKIEHCYPKELSGGMQQRIALLRTLIVNPKIVILDESFGALDVLTRHRMQTFFLKLHEEFKFTAILVTHDVNEATVLGDEIVLLNNNLHTGFKIIENPISHPGKMTQKSYELQEELVNVLENVDIQQ
jgi:ABC-type nitrate/sulfonate/bicarbonate transport system ATPase subunit